MKIYLIGVFHNFQTEKHSDFLDYLRDTCANCKIRSIAEEMSNDALRLAEVEKSTILKLAEELDLPHAYCDPDEDDRKKYRILGQQDIEWNQFFNELSDEEAESLKSQHDGKREKLWLEKIIEVFVDPMLFICGIQHLGSFSSLLKENRYDCFVMERKWSPNKSLESDA